MDQTAQEALNEYMIVIRDLTRTAGAIARVEETKTEAAAGKRHELLDGCIQEEQALLLKLRGLEQHRMKLQQALGWDSLTLQQILEKASGEQAETLTPLFQQLEQQLNRLLYAHQNAEQIIKVRLHELEVFTSQGASYNNDGKVNPSGNPPGRIRSKYV